MVKFMLSNIFEIIKDDIKALAKNPIALVVFIVLLLIPSIYGLTNTAVSWDPSEETENLDFAIVNNDKPVTINSQTYNFGKTIEDNLTSSDKYNWVILNEDDAKKGVDDGKYMATLIIPSSNFTEDILAISNGLSSEKASLVFYDSHKESSMMYSITNASSLAIINEINDDFAKSFNNQTLSKVNGPVSGELLNLSVEPIELIVETENDSNHLGDLFYAFYTSISLWVGALVSCVIMNINPSKPISEKRYKSYEAYFGKLFIFILIAILQALILFALTLNMGVQVTNSFMLLLGLVVSSLAYMIIVYSLISALGNVGKLIAVIGLVLQVGATGGVYPIEITTAYTSLFQTINPYLPITYGIQLLREGVFNLNWSILSVSLVSLLVFAAIFIIIALLIKSTGFVDRAVAKMNKTMRDSGLFN